MKRMMNFAMLLMAAVAMTVLTVSCGDDDCQEYKDKVDYLAERVNGIDERVKALEQKVEQMNKDLETLSVLAKTIESGFYITEVITTFDGYELKLSNGRKLVLTNGEDGAIAPAPDIRLVENDGVYYWWVNGRLLTGTDGKPVRASIVPKLRWNIETLEWEICIDGSTWTATGVRIIDEVTLWQVINKFVVQNSETLISDETLFTIVSNFIQQNYSSLFDINLMSTVINNYIEDNYSTIFSSTLLNKAINEYISINGSNSFNVDVMTTVILNFMEQNKNVFINSDVFLSIMQSYVDINQNAIFSPTLIQQVINNYIAQNPNFIDSETIRIYITNYINEHIDEVFTENSLNIIITGYINQHLTEIFTAIIINQVIAEYLKQNTTEFITLIMPYIKEYVEKNYTTIFTDNILQIVINNYIEEHNTQIFNETIVKNAIIEYVEEHYLEIFDITIIEQIIINYFENSTTIINISNNIIVDYDNDVVYIYINGGTRIPVPYYREKVQSIVWVPDWLGEQGMYTRINLGYTNSGEVDDIVYMVTPTSMARKIYLALTSGKMGIQFVGSNGGTENTTIRVSNVNFTNEGYLKVKPYLPDLTLYYENNYYNRAIALWIKDESPGGTDFVTTFTPIYVFKRDIKDWQ